MQNTQQLGSHLAHDFAGLGQTLEKSHAHAGVDKRASSLLRAFVQAFARVVEDWQQTVIEQSLDYYMTFLCTFKSKSGFIQQFR